MSRLSGSRSPVQVSPASCGQIGLYLDEMIRFSHFNLTPYSVPIVIRTQGLQPTLFKYAIQQIIQKHQAFRTTIHIDQNNNIVQHIHEFSSGGADCATFVSWSTCDVSDESSLSQYICNNLRHPFNLSQGPLFRCSFITLKDEIIVMMNIHHIIFDGTSTVLLARELTALYNHAVAKTTPTTSTTCATSCATSPSPTTNCNIDLNLDTSYYNLLPPLPSYTHIDYVSDETKLLESAEWKSSINFWRQQLDGGMLLTLDLPLDRTLTNMTRTMRGGVYRQSHSLPISLQSSMEHWRTDMNCSMYQVLLSCFTLFLHKLSRTNQTDICFGSVCNNRYSSSLSSLIGYYVNTLPYRTNIQPTQTFHELQQQTSTLRKNIIKHQHIPFHTIVKECASSSSTPSSSSSSSSSSSTPALPFFQVLLTLEKAGEYARDMNLSGVTTTPYDHMSVYDVSMYDLRLHVEQHQDGSLWMVWHYSTDIWDQQTIHVMSERWIIMLNHLFMNDATAARTLPMHDISIIHPTDVALVTQLNNSTYVDFGLPQCIHDIWLQHARTTPNKIAVSLDDINITYSTLVNRASYVAHHLQVICGVTNNTIVAQCVSRSIDMVVGIMAILLCGAIYCPLNPADPTQRLQQLINNTKATVLLTQQHWKKHLGFNTQQQEQPSSQQAQNAHILTNIVVLDDPSFSSDMTHDDTSPISLVHTPCSPPPSQVAYMIHTSGSTGVPKSALLTHSGFYNTIRGYMHHGSLLRGNDEIIANLAACSHDMHAFEIIGAMFCGAQLVMLKHQGNLDLDYLSNTLCRFGVTTGFMVPPVALVLLEYLEGCGELSRLHSFRYLYLGGDVVSPKTVSKFHQLTPHIDIYSYYGPAEITIGSTYHLCTKQDVQAQYIPLGLPMPNYTHYILDEYGNDIPIGGIGEICIGGPGVFAGYWNEPALTQRALVHHIRTNTILYRTGDLGRMRHPDGSIYFCGRVDFQVKLRGQRVEMGEIEATIRKHQHVSDCIVIKRQHQQHEYLAAYVQPTPISISDSVDVIDTTHRDSVLQSELITMCQQRLAGYMVPTSWVIIPTLPHTANGKIDRKALPEPVFATQTSTEAPTATSTSSTAVSASAASSMPTPEPGCVSLLGPSVYSGVVGIVHSLWKRLLAPATDPCLSSYGLDISFFHCGGHSLAAMQLLTMIRKRFPETQQHIHIQHIFTHNTIQAQAQLIQTWEKQPQTPKPSSSQPQETKPAPFPNSISSSSVSSLASSDSRSGSGSSSGLDIAIVGMDGCFPGAATIDEFWDLLRRGGSGVVDISKDPSLNISPDLDLSLVPPSVLSDPSYIGRVGRLSDIDLFDASYYGITAAEARLMDPQHRLLIEKCHGALQHAGIRLDDKTKTQQCGVYVACGDSTYLTHHLQSELEANPCDTSQQYRVRVANTTSSVAQRIAFSLNLGGPALHVGTACSSSLSTLSVALDQLRSGRCETAVVGAAAISTPQHGYIPQTGMIFSPTGECRPFDRNADGTVLGYAVSAIVIKSLHAAERDGDHIMAIIKGCGINNNGYTGLSFTAPSVTSQADCIKQAMVQANVIPQQISYIEAHGTATPLGDVVEMAALTTAFETDTCTSTTNPSLQQYCTVGSVKSNIGHTDTASGLVGLIKTVLCLEHQQLVPTLPIQSEVSDVDVTDDNIGLNPLIPFGSSPFRVYRSSASPMIWKPIHPDAINKPLTAGVSSFGVGGTNVHVILQQYTQHNNNNRYINLPSTHQQTRTPPVVCGDDHDGPNMGVHDQLGSLRLGAWSCDMQRLSSFHGSVKPLGLQLSLDVDNNNYNTDVTINDVATGEYHVYVISGRDEAGLNRRCQQLLVWLQSQYAQINIAEHSTSAALHQFAIDLAYTLRNRTQWHKHRHTIIAPTIKHLIQQLTLLTLPTKTNSGSGSATPVPGSGAGSLLVKSGFATGPAASFGRVVLCIPGTTRNDRSFIRVMLTTCTPFRQAYAQVAKCVQQLAPATDIEALPLTHTSNSISDPAAAADSGAGSFDLVDEHAMRFATLYALTEIWLRSIYGEKTGKPNIPPYQVCVMGHSLGEYVAACVSGVLTLEEAVGLVVSRAQIITALQDSNAASGSGSVSLLSGRMLACRLTESSALSYVSSTISIAAINSVNQVVFAGRPDAISVLAIELKRKGVLCRLLPADVPFHSHLMEPTIKPFKHAYHNILQVQPRALPKHTTHQIQFISTIRADWVTSDTIIDAQHWAMHLTQPVRFAKAVLLAAATAATSSSSSSSSSCDSCFIEVSDCALLSKLIQPIVPSAIIIAPAMGTNTSNIDRDRAHQPLQSQDPSQAPTPNPAAATISVQVQGQVRTFRGTTLLKIDTSTSTSASICSSPSISCVLEVQAGFIRALTAVGAKHNTGHLDWNYVQKLFCQTNTNTDTIGNTSSTAAAAHPINSFTDANYNYNSNSNSSTPVSELETGIATADYSPPSSSLRSGSPAMSLPLSLLSSDSDFDEDVDLGTCANASAWIPKFIPLPSYPLNRLSHWVRPTHIRRHVPTLAHEPATTTTTVEHHDSQPTTVADVDSSHDGSASASDFDRVLSCVAAVICGVLGVDHSLVGSDVNFFDDLGGDSFTAILLLNRLNSQLQLEPQLQTKQLLETQTPTRITQTIIEQHTYTRITQTNNTTPQPQPQQQPSIQKQASQDAPAHPITSAESMLMDSLRSFERDSELIVLRSAVSGLEKSYPPLFLLAPCGGTVFVYRDLVSSLPITQPVYAIAYPECDINTSVVQLATLYNTTLQRLANIYHDLFQHWQLFQHGIRLVGMSFGGMVAYEMASQALSNPMISFYVSRLIMIDSPLASALRVGHVSNRGELLAIMFSNKHGITKEDVQGLTEDSQLIQLCCDKQVFRDETITSTSTSTAEQNDGKVQLQGRFSPAILSQWNQLSKYMDIFSANISMLLGYSVSSWSPPSGRACRCLFFESMSPRDFEPQQPSRAWKEVFQHPQPASSQLENDSSINVYVVPGNHISMNHGAGAHVMAGYIRHHLDLEH